ncbi:class I SAM-dependent methyltransferase [Actinopolymorpha pittospori]|uniref:SAM-dependent methyltransferase n=1 Tax=Actinopolymorpha pittospori TaxID=648752 RepID=A0A927MYV8_9ACTN|nr:class I SAM-dependent methyltransferase [Actinopolymorpha pittospori]MBE1609486.1 SAM-dependent methyltransferase [Actinopolymorpha pittospori]
MTSQTWNASLYDDKHGFVSALGAGVIDLLDARPGERVLDVGCGTGDHVASLRAAGVEVTGVDASADMISRAREKFPDLPVRVADVRDLPFDAEFDAVLSNATLHWVREAPAAASSIARALAPGGRFVAEFGGAGNIATIADGAQTLRKDLGLAPAQSPWFFPTIGVYAAMLEAVGLEVSGAWLFDRPTQLVGEDGLANWLTMFCAHLLVGVPDVDGFLAELATRLRPVLYRDGSWWADYRRIRVTAVKPALRGAAASPA